jgi:hypothetical protein
MPFSDYLNQSELAASFEVDRSTITKWQHEGLPYAETAKGLPHRYNVGTAIYWAVGRDYIKAKRLKPVDTITQILLGHSVAMKDEPGWEETARKLARKIGVTGAAFSEAFGIAKGIRLAKG